MCLYSMHMGESETTHIRVLISVHTTSLNDVKYNVCSHSI